MYLTTEQQSTAENSIKHKEENKMQVYKIFVDGQYVGTTELTNSEVKAYNTLEGVTVTKA